MIYLIKSALLSHYYSFKRSIGMFVVFFFSLTSLFLFLGYYNYSKDGMILGARASTGDLVIQSRYADSPRNTEDFYFDLDQRLAIDNIVEEPKGIKSISNLYNFSALAGDDTQSYIAFGQSSDSPDALAGLDLVAGDILYEEDEGLIVAEGLAKKLSLGIGDYITLMSTSPLYGLSLSSFPVMGIVKIPSLQANNGLILTNTRTMQNFLGEEFIANKIRLDLSSLDNLKAVKAEIAAKLADDLTIYDWDELNPQMEQVLGLYDTFFLFLKSIFLILVFVSILVFISSILNERLSEIGTLRALGYTKWAISFSLLVEIFSLYFVAILFAILATKSVNLFLTANEISYTPPGFTEGFPVDLLVSTTDYLSMSLLLFIPIVLSLIPSLVKIFRKSIKELLNYV